jgi:hypothetical protein
MPPSFLRALAARLERAGSRTARRNSTRYPNCPSRGALCRIGQRRIKMHARPRTVRNPIRTVTRPPDFITNPPSSKTNPPSSITRPNASSFETGLQPKTAIPATPRKSASATPRPRDEPVPHSEHKSQKGKRQTRRRRSMLQTIRKSAQCYRRTCFGSRTTARRQAEDRQDERKMHNLSAQKWHLAVSKTRLTPTES